MLTLFATHPASISDDDDEDFEVPPPQASPPLTPGHRKSSIRMEADRVDLQKNFSKLDLSKYELF